MSLNNNLRKRKSKSNDTIKNDTKMVDSVSSSLGDPDLNNFLSNNTLSNEKKNLQKPGKYTNWWRRLASTIGLIFLFAFILYAGPTFVTLLVIFIQLNAYNEIITIGYRIYKMYELDEKLEYPQFPRFRSLAWYFLCCVNYYFYGELIQSHLVELAYFQKNQKLLNFLMLKHRFITYFGFLLGFLTFVLSLRKGYYAKQFFFFGWMISSLMIVVAQSHMFITNLMNGLIWVVLPATLVATNDSMAYICGFFWPWKKTQLIALSPKKTWEGFIGGGIFTLIIGWFLGSLLAQTKHFSCPVQVTSDFMFSIDYNCKTDPIFEVRDMINVPLIFGSKILQNLLGREIIRMRMIQIHSCVIALFAAIVAPFGGFFASGLKRGFKIKDFGDTIPGHGGFLDRFDCHFMVGVFTSVYLATFVKVPNIKKLLILASRMDYTSQGELLVSLTKRLAGHLSLETMNEIKSLLG